jgi:hypothetical protein
MDTLARLDALEQIRVLKARYCRYVDTKDWSGFASLFTDQAMVCFPENNPDWVPIAAFLPAVDTALLGGISVHHVHSPEISFQGDVDATGIWAMQDHLFFPPGVAGLANASRIAGAGHYHETYRRIEGLWLFDRIRLTRLHLAVELQSRTVI